MSNVKESVIEDYLVATVERLGGEIRKVKWIGRRGAPDRRVMLNPNPFWVELKRPKKGLDEHQKREIARMRSQGERVEVFNTIEAIDNFFRELGYV